MFRKFTVRLFSIIFLPLVACQLLGGQAVQTPNASVEVTNVPFKTLNEVVFSRTAQDADLMVATNITETQTIANQLNPDQPVIALPKLTEIDFEKSIMVVAYFGFAPFNNYKITVEKITQTENTMDVYVQTVEPEMGDAMISHPIHIVKVNKTNLSRMGELTFRLWKNSEIVVQHNYLIQ